MRFFRTVLLCLAAMSFAAIAGVPSDSLGTIGSLIIDKLSDVKIIGPFAENLYLFTAATLGYLITLAIQFALKKIPTKWKWSDKLQDVGVSFIWRILAKLFGKSILYYRAKTEQDFEAQRLAVKLKDHLKKHDPLLSIDIEKLMQKKE